MNGGFFTRLGLGGIPFLFPLLYQVGLGFSPIQSGLLVLPQAIASIGLKTFMPAILARLGYRNVLVFNTIVVGLLIMSFATVGRGDADLAHRPAGLRARFLHLDAIHQHEHAGLRRRLGLADQRRQHDRRHRQQLAISFGVAGASLIAALFVPVGLHTHAATMIYGVQQAFLVLGIITVLSSVVFNGN